MLMRDWPGMLGYLGAWAQQRIDDLGTTELAMYTYDEGTGVDRRSRLLVATELGLLEVVEVFAGPAEAGPGPDVWKITGDLHSWAMVRGARLSFSQIGERQAAQVRVGLDHPAFEQEMNWADNPLREALRDFGVTCLGKARPPAAED